MHILIGLITAIAGLVWALYRLQNSGVDLNSFNPFYWLRRRNWEKQLVGNPAYALTNPMEAASLIIVALAKVKGELARETKMEILKLFQKEFGVTEAKANELFAASTHMISQVVEIKGEIDKILSPSKEHFKSDYIKGFLDMLEHVSKLEGEPLEIQKEIINKVNAFYKKLETASQGWQ